MSKDIAVAAIGNANMDVVFIVDKLPSADEEALAESVSEHPGGSASNFAVAVSRLGLRSIFLGAVGRDEYGDRLISNFKANNVETKFIIKSSKPTGRVIIAVSKKGGERLMIALRGANYDVTPENLPVDGITSANHLHISGAKLEVAAWAFKLAKESGLTTSYDPGGIVIRKGMDGLAPILPYVDILFLNKVEARTLIRWPGQTLLETYPRDDQILVVKVGANGSCGVYRGSAVYVPSFKVNAVDTTGAGDSFAAAFVVGYLKGLSLRDTLLFANAVGALKVTRLGAQSCPQLGEVLEFLEQRGFEEASRRIRSKLLG